MIDEILSKRRAVLRTAVTESPHTNSHSTAFVVRILTESEPSIRAQLEDGQSQNPQTVGYQGTPGVASLGFQIGTGDDLGTEVTENFINGVRRLMQRTDDALSSLVGDDVALLGVADGIAHLPGTLLTQLSTEKDRLLELLARPIAHPQWSSRMRDLAADLLDRRGRLRARPDNAETDALALDLVLHSTWPQAFDETPPWSDQKREALLKSLLTLDAPFSGDVERAAIWLRAIDVLVTGSIQTIISTPSDTAILLKRIQHGFKRWPWKDKGRRKDTMPTRWLIDDEYDVQSLLWAVLHPIYGPELVDETYLPNWDNTQPRADLGIRHLKLIIEVKIARQPNDFNKIEGEIGNDLGLYFKDVDLFDRMIVFIYDDCDHRQPEKHDGLRNALMKRDRIEDVIIVERPGMIPNRNERNLRPEAIL